MKYVSRLREKHAKIKHNVKGEATEQQLTSLLHEQFLFSRETHRKTPVPDTPVKKKLRMELKKSKAEAKGMKRKLIEYEAHEEELRDTLEQERVTTGVLNSSSVSSVWALFSSTNTAFYFY